MLTMLNHVKNMLEKGCLNSFYSIHFAPKRKVQCFLTPKPSKTKTWPSAPAPLYWQIKRTSENVLIQYNIKTEDMTGGCSHNNSFKNDKILPLLPSALIWNAIESHVPCFRIVIAEKVTRLFECWDCWRRQQGIKPTFLPLPHKT